ncbi:prepilin peptidase [Vibrio paucivorans]
MDLKWLLIGGLIIATLFIFLSDIVHRLIPNCIVVFVAVSAISLMILNESYASLNVTILIFIIGLVLHSKNVLGGGDIKLVLAYSTAIKPELSLLYIVIILLLGGILATFYWGCHRVFGNVTNPKEGLPYGLPIGVSGIFCIAASIA